jgi:hypothetical protein
MADRHRCRVSWTCLACKIGIMVVARPPKWLERGKLKQTSAVDSSDVARRGVASWDVAKDAFEIPWRCQLFRFCQSGAQTPIGRSTLAQAVAGLGCLYSLGCACA